MKLCKSITHGCMSLMFQYAKKARLLKSKRTKKNNEIKEDKELFYKRKMENIHVWMYKY